MESEDQKYLLIQFLIPAIMPFPLPELDEDFRMGDRLGWGWGRLA
jgi:hypothetical protein